MHDALCRTLDALATEQGLALQSQTPTEKFRESIEKMSAGGQVVVLIDEYDKPIIDYLNDTDVAAANRELLKGFYGILKGLGNSRTTNHFCNTYGRVAQKNTL